MCYMMDMHIFEREMGGRRYRVAGKRPVIPILS